MSNKIGFVIITFIIALVIIFTGGIGYNSNQDFQIIQSMYAIGPGSLFGFGFQNSLQKHFYLQRHFPISVP